jgi:glyceraldehyde 3-phosphate dehydrogenase
VDGPNKDLRRGRAASWNIVPTTTGAAEATIRALPEMEGRFTGLSIRVPVPTVSVADFSAVVKQRTTVEAVNDAYRSAAQAERYAGVVAVTEEPVVSSDFIGDPHSAIVDLKLTQVVNGDLVKVVAWYDNEWGYANRLVEQAIAVGQAIGHAG